MVTITHLTKKLVEENIMLEDYLSRGLINYIALAEKLKPRIEKELGKKIKVSSIAMALRRASEKAKQKQGKNYSLKNCDLTLKGNLCDITVYKSPALFAKLKKLYEIVDYNKGDILNIIHGNYDVSIITNESFEKKLKNMLDGEKILNSEKNLVALTVKFGDFFMHIPGVTYSLLKQLVAENINLIEILSSLVEVTFIIDKKDATKGYNALEEFLEK